MLVLVAGAVCVRRGLDGWPGATSKTAGLVFAGLLLAIWVCARRPGMDGGAGRLRWPHAALAGLAGAALLCAGPLVFHLTDPSAASGGALPLTWFPAWAAVVIAVAVTEELVLRGTLWRAVTHQGRDLDHDAKRSDPRRAGYALVVTTVAFAALHVPFYGWESVPVNLAAGTCSAASGWRPAPCSPPPSPIPPPISLDGSCCDRSPRDPHLRLGGPPAAHRPRVVVHRARRPRRPAGPAGAARAPHRSTTASGFRTSRTAGCRRRRASRRPPRRPRRNRSSP